MADYTGQRSAKLVNGTPPGFIDGLPRASRATTVGPTRWKFKTTPQVADIKVAQACRIAPVTAAILRARGHATVQAVQSYLTDTPSALRDPMLLPDIVPAVRRLHTAISGREPLLIFGDYDVDGVTSTALLSRALRKLGGNITTRIPERHEGYGLSVAAVEQAAHDGVRLILTADNGITALDAVARARQLGIDVIITDHHDPGAELPAALAVINPKRADSQYGFRELCGCGVAFKLLQALLAEHWPRAAASFEEKYIDLAGLATVADCVPLIDENRILARAGLRRLANGNRPGVQALIASASLKIAGDSLTGRHVSFSLAPRLNAAGRLDSPQKSFRLLISDDAAECERLAAELGEFNKLRQDTTSRMMFEALDLIREHNDLTRDCFLVVARDGWNGGVIGLVASRIVEMYARPVIVLNVHDDTAHGSGRSIDGFDLHPLLDHTRDLLLSGGGHAAACGLSLHSNQLEPFKQRVLHYAGARLTCADLVPTVEADCLVRPGDLTHQLAVDLAKLEPCGKGNEAAMLMLKDATLVDGRAMGQDNMHLKWRLQADGRFFEAVWWRPGDQATGFKIGQRLDLCFVPELNHYQGTTRLQLVVKEARLA